MLRGIVRLLLLFALVACDGGGDESNPTPDGPLPDSGDPDAAPDGPAPDTAEAAPIIVFVVRHAETTPNAGTDPPLSEAGIARAQTLAAELADDTIGLVLASQFKRTQLTGEPTANAAGIPVTVLAASGNTLAYGEQLETMVRAAGVGAALIVGHSNTVPATVKAFTGTDVAPIAETEYDRLYTITVRGEDATVVESTF